MKSAYSEVEAKQTIRVLSFDFDGCLAANYYKKTVVKCHQRFLDSIKKENKKYKAVKTFVGSNRQSWLADYYNARTNGNGSCFPAIQEISDYLKTTFDNFLLADIYGDVEDGTAYGRAMAQLKHKNVSLTHPDYIFDNSKVTILYAQVHKVATEYRNQNIVFDFYDDRKDILGWLQTFYGNNPWMMPKNVTLRLHHYAGNAVKDYPDIQGTGMIDGNYRETVKEMGEGARDALCKDNELLYHNHGVRVDKYTPRELTKRQHFKPPAKNIIEDDKLPPLNRQSQDPAMQTFYDRLAAIMNKTNELLQDKSKSELTQMKAEAGRKLYTSLCKQVNIYMGKGEDTIKQANKVAFCSDCKEAISIARPVLEKHRDWMPILFNIALAIAGLGVFYGIAGLINMGVTGRFLFFQTDSGEKLDNMKKTLENLSEPTIAPAA